MDQVFAPLLADIEGLLDSGPEPAHAAQIMALLGAGVPEAQLAHMTLYAETLPKGREPPFTAAERCLHFLWDALETLPQKLMVNFAFPYRRLLAARLFKSCGQGLICEENVRFNFGRYLSLGDHVFFNRGIFLDTKGGLSIGCAAALAEDVRVFSHGHSESSHMERSYAPVTIGDYVKVYSGATILPGVTIGAQAIVAAGSLVNRDVPPNMVVAGTPAKVIRERRTGGRSGEELDHLWLF
jgi:acetyltransferase-like isoleucine patch superfamily enzyme